MIVGKLVSYVAGFIVASSIEGAFTAAILQSEAVKDNTFLRVMIIVVSAIAIYGVVLGVAHLVASLFSDE
jgi:biotin transporter BioY